MFCCPVLHALAAISSWLVLAQSAALISTLKLEPAQAGPRIGGAVTACKLLSYQEHIHKHRDDRLRQTPGAVQSASAAGQGRIALLPGRLQLAGLGQIAWWSHHSLTSEAFLCV